MTTAALRSLFFLWIPVRFNLDANFKVVGGGVSPCPMWVAMWVLSVCGNL